VELGGSEVPLGLVVREPDVEVVHLAQDRPAVGGEGGDEIERAPFYVVAGAVGRFWVGGDAVSDEGVVALGEAALEGWSDVVV
jgi:hypothetical protein